MREQIIFAPGANGRELIKSLAMHGKNTFNLRIMGAGALSRYALMRAGIPITEDFIDSREEAAIVAESVKGEAYFGKATYSDIRAITSAIKRMRTLITDENEEESIEKIMKQGIFSEKNAALVSVFEKYMMLIRDQNLLDAVSLIRKAIKEGERMDAEFIILSEYPLNPLEKELLQKLSDGTAKESDLKELFGIEGTKLQIESFKNCYGASNEVETILSDIYQGTHLDQCIVALTDPSTYVQLFFDYALLYDLPITFGCGIPIINSNPARLLALYHRWMTDGFYGRGALNEMISSDAFNRKKFYALFTKTRDVDGDDSKETPDIENPDTEPFDKDTFEEVFLNLRLTNDAKINKKRISDFKKALEKESAQISEEDTKAYEAYSKKVASIPHLETLSKELTLPAEDFLVKYAYIRKNTGTNADKLLMKLDKAASDVIFEELKVIRAFGDGEVSGDMLFNVLKLSVLAGKSEEGKLFVTGIDGALSTIRKNLYIAGLSATKYPGSPKENSLLLDKDLELFGKDINDMTSEGRVIRKREKLLSLARVSSSLDVKVHVSYAGLNVSELKKENASSLIFELYREAFGRNVALKEMEEHIEKIPYFAPAISVTRGIGEAYNEGKTILKTKSYPVYSKLQKDALSLDKAYSPSALETFFTCKRRFMLSRVLGISEADDENLFETIDAKESGTMAHALMERLANSDISREDFLKLSKETFDRYMIENPPLVAQNADQERTQFLDMMATAYRMEQKREVVLQEEDVSCTHESGVKLHGLPDRVEKLDNGRYMIVDFKSGYKVKHNMDDIDTCLQVVIYAYLMEQRGLDIAGGIYRYIRLGKTVTCKYDEEMKEKLNEKLMEFKTHMEAADFPIPDSAYPENRERDDPDPCKYCQFGQICGK